MKVTIDDSFTLESDAYSFCLKHLEATKINSRTGKPMVRAVYTYHPTMQHALKYYLSESTKEADTVEQILDIIKESMQKIDSLQFPTLAQTRIG